MIMKDISPDVLQKLFTTPVTIIPMSNTDSLGDATEGTPVQLYGYVFEEIKKVTNVMGEEVLSGMQIYLRGIDIDSIEMSSKVTCGRAVKQQILTKEVWRGEASSVVIGILYLP